MGEVTAATAEKGERIWDVMTRRLVELVDDLKRLSLDEIFQRRYQGAAMWSEDRTRRYLQDRLAILEDRVAEIETILREPEDRDLDEQALDLDDDGVLEGLGRSNRQEIEEIKDAVTRLDAGTYGKCKSCNRRIGQLRLKILPQTTICIRCSRKTA